tara:strand:- start:168 stop:722 length:555 start_codon:yes stop_codon:yes gene_type:complete
MLRRIIGALLLKDEIYEEIESDRGATIQAVLVVVLSQLAISVWFLVLLENSNSSVPVSWSISDTLFAVVQGIIYWALLAGVIYVIGVTLFNTNQTQATWGEVARTIGFAQTPNLFLFSTPLVVTFAEVLALWLGLACVSWTLAATVIAVRAALDYKSTIRAILVVVAGYAVAVSCSFVFQSIFS